MRRRTWMIIVLIIIGVFFLVQAKYAFQMKLLTMVVEEKVTKTIESVSDKISETNNEEKKDTKNIVQNAQASEKSIQETLAEVKKEKPKSDFTESKKLTLSEKEIADKYVERFEGLRTQFIDRMSALIDQAKTEYMAMSETERNEKKISLGLKYMELGESMEKECDAQFQATLTEMKKELKKNGAGLSLADTARMEYEQQKNGLKRTLVSRIMN